ncbi:MAG: hypothetical protein ACJ74G_21860, partial [Blastocatellia bacterium]
RLSRLGSRSKPKMKLEQLKDKEHIVGRHRIEDAEKAIVRQGYSADDFDFRLAGGNAITTTGVVPIEATLHVIYVPTGITRSYQTGHGSSWSVDFENDLAGGVFKS